MATANQIYFDAAIRHQVGVQRFTSGQIRAVLRLLERNDRELVKKLRSRLARFAGKPIDFRSKRFQALLNDIRKARSVAMAELRARLTPDLDEYAKVEAQMELRLLKRAIPIQIDFAGVAAEQLRTIVHARPFQGDLLKEHYQRLAASDRVRLRRAIQDGMVQGESIPDIVRRIAGTRRKGFTDGALGLTRQQATAMTRTAVNHISNRAREAIWDANSDIIDGLRWTATLDGRTTPICRARDGKVVATGGNPIPEGMEPLMPQTARPPAHYQCRSVMVAIINQNVHGNRPFVTDIRGRRAREIDFRQESRRTGKSIQTVRRQWGEKNIGRVPAKTTYNQWLRRQPAEFQDSILGKTKGRLYRQGKVQMDEFVDRRGNELTLAELADTKPEAFVSAGLDPDLF